MALIDFNRPIRSENERSVRIGGVEYMSVAEYVERLYPNEYPVVDELITVGGQDQTYNRLGQIASALGRKQGIQPAKLYHQEHTSINGWPQRIIAIAWGKFVTRYQSTMRWLPRDETPANTFAQAVALIRQSSEAVHRDRHWIKVYTEDLAGYSAQDETPEEALVRRTSAAATLYAIEKEYEQR